MTRLIIVLVFAVGLLGAQVSTPEPQHDTVTTDGGGRLAFDFVTPAGAPAGPVPVVVIPQSASEKPDASLAAALVKSFVDAGFAVARVTELTRPGGSSDPMIALCHNLRLRIQVEGCRFFAAARGEVTLGSDVAPEFVNASPLVLNADDVPGLVRSVTGLRIAQRLSSPDAQAAAEALDGFCDAASRADLDRYLGHFAEDGVFLGTDATERWTVAEFRAFAAPYFKKGGGWIFVPTARRIVPAPDGAAAAFDEDLFSRSYARCRGTGSLRRVAGRWLIVQYSLSIPIPNDLATPIVNRIRAFGRGARIAPGRRTIYVVRHAEKDESNPTDKDPVLSPAGAERAKDLARVLGSVKLAAIYTTEYRRTQLTAAAFSASGATPTIISTKESAKLSAALENMAPGSSILVISHSNVIPDLLKRLGVSDAIELGDHDYDNLFVVSMEPGEKPGFQRFHYGAAPAR